ncbi:MAG: nucleotidyltransferase family protein [Ruminococcus sp.]|nr:nucleotidyltransferase family protein [Ruminococcus sp.]
MEKFKNEYSYLIHLLKSILNGTQPEEKPDNLSYEKLLDHAIRHSVANIAYYAVEKLNKKPNSDINKKWAEYRDRAIVKDLTQTLEFDAITQAFENENIRFLALKGIFLKDMYPQRDMRLMADIDLLIDQNNMDKANKIMLSLGYEPETTSDKDHDAYFKQPMMNVEVHRQLFGQENESFSLMFSDPWKNTLEITDGVLNLTDNWFFLYLFAHLDKHLNNGGTGIRTIMDIYVYLQHKENSLDWEFIYSQLAKVGKAQVCRDVIALSKIWFGDSPSSEKYDEFARFILSSGTYGTRLNSNLNKHKRMGTFRFVIHRIFPPLYIMQMVFPFLKKVPFLFPLMWPVRLIYRGLFRGKKIIHEIKYIKKNK